MIKKNYTTGLVMFLSYTVTLPSFAQTTFESNQMMQKEVLIKGPQKFLPLRQELYENKQSIIKASVELQDENKSKNDPQGGFLDWVILELFSNVSADTYSESVSTSTNGIQISRFVENLGTRFKQVLGTSKTAFTINLLRISDISATPTDTDVVIKWNANNLALGRIYYSTISPVMIASSTSWVNASSYGNYANSKANIRHMRSHTTYYFKIFVKDSDGNTATSNEASFTTE